MAARKCKYGRLKGSKKCRKTPKRRKGASAGRRCKTVKLPGRRQKMCKKGKYWRFAA